MIKNMMSCYWNLVKVTLAWLENKEKISLCRQTHELLLATCNDRTTLWDTTVPNSTSSACIIFPVLMSIFTLIYKLCGRLCCRITNQSLFNCFCNYRVSQTQVSIREIEMKPAMKCKKTGHFNCGLIFQHLRMDLGLNTETKEQTLLSIITLS